MTDRLAISAGNLSAPPAPERNAAILAYKAAHPAASFSEIGAVFGVSRNTVAGVLDRAFRRRRTAARRARIAAARERRRQALLAALDQGAGVKAIAKAFDTNLIRAAFIVRDHRRASAEARR